MKCAACGHDGKNWFYIRLQIVVGSLEVAGTADDSKSKFFACPKCNTLRIGD